MSQVDHYQVDEHGLVTVREGVPPEAIKAIASVRRAVTKGKEPPFVVMVQSPPQDTDPKDPPPNPAVA